MNPTHHLNRSRYYLNCVPGNTAVGDYDRAAKDLARSASHAVTAAAVHWRHRHHSRRRLNVVLGELVYNNRVAHGHYRTFQMVYRFAEQASDASPDAARKTLRNLRRRVSRLVAAIATAISNDPNPANPEIS